MKPKLQSQQEVTINTPLERVWEFNQDLTKIAEYHPRVDKVDLISGKAFREAGVAYQCHLSDGKNTCIEKDIEIIPMQKIATILPEDTMEISKLLTDYVVETLFTKLDERTTKMEFHHFYSTKTLKVKLLNLIARTKIARESQDTLNAIKKAIEDEYVINSTR
jgi:Polyketide cyclase / dehydrase and lipid transport.